MEHTAVTLHLAAEYYALLIQEDGHHVGNGVTLILRPTPYGTHHLTVHIEPETHVPPAAP